MDFRYRKHRIFNILTISLPLFCFLLSSWGATTSSPPSLSSAVAASDILRARGYTLFSSAIISTLATTTFNLSGTIFAPPDFAFSLRRRPSTPLLLFHTLPPPPLPFLPLISHSPKHFPSLHNNLCLFLSKTPSGEISISSSAARKLRFVKIRQPDLYVDDQLTVHGIDGVLDPSGADQCPTDDHSYDDYQPLPEKRKPERFRIEPQGGGEGGVRVYNLYLDHAIRVLRKRGFNFVATALAMRRGKLVGLKAVTVFAPSDRTIFLGRENGFRYDFLHHVVPQRLRFDSLSRQTVGFTAFETLAENKSVIVEAIEGVVRVDGVRVDGTEIYFNRWIVVFSIPMTLDDAAEGLLKPNGIPSSPLPPESPDSDQSGTPPSDIAGDTDTPSSESCDEGGETTTVTIEPMEPPPSEGVEEPEPTCPPLPPMPPVVDIGVVIDGVTSPPPPVVVIVETPTEVEPIPPADEAAEPRCLGVETEGEDLNCPSHTTVRKLQEADVEECDPSDGVCKLKEKVAAVSKPVILKAEVNIADDLFFYA